MTARDFKHTDQPATRTLRLFTCGSVDDGKSTLIGRMLYEAGAVRADQLEQLRLDSQRFGTQGDALDYALLVDGLVAEREQGITIDVAYRYLAWGDSRIILADTPGHAQYTRNMISGASLAHAAIILVDATRGITEQTQLHAFLVHWLKVPEVLVVINKMDAVGYDAEVCARLKGEVIEMAARLGIPSLSVMPLSALKGEQVATPSQAMPWAGDLTLFGWIESRVTQQRQTRQTPACLAVQYVQRDEQGQRLYHARLLAGAAPLSGSWMHARLGREVKMTLVSSTLSSPQEMANVTFRLDEAVDVSRGDCLMAPGEPEGFYLGRRFAVELVWMDEQACSVGREYLLQIGFQLVPVQIDRLEGVYSVARGQFEPQEALGFNQIAACHIACRQPVFCASFETLPALGRFILIDAHTHATVAAGQIVEGLDKPQDKAEARAYRFWEIALNRFICRRYPQWGCKCL